MKRMLYALVICIAVITALIYARWIEPNWLEIHTVILEVPGLDPRLEGFTILHLTDLHQQRFGPGQEILAAAIGDKDYDIVAFTGDAVSYPLPYDFTPAAELIALLKAPVYFVFGNHDYPHFEDLARDLSAAGAIILANSRREVTYNGAVVQIAGIHDPSWAHNNLDSWMAASLDVTLLETDPDQFTLLLSHSPGIFAAAAQQDIDLVLCGHTHGGQIKIPLLGAPTTASGKLFDKYVQGLYTLEDTRLYINRGLGTTGWPVRFMSRPEAVFIRLVAGD